MIFFKATPVLRDSEGMTRHQSCNGHNAMIPFHACTRTIQRMPALSTDTCFPCHPPTPSACWAFSMVLKAFPTVADPSFPTHHWGKTVASKSNIRWS